MDILPLRDPVSAWTHGIAAVLALPGAWILWQRAADEPGKRFSLLVYGLTLIFCYAASTLFHSVRLPSDRLAAFARLDSAGIFALIAGSYTPLAWNILPGRWRWGTLAAVWSVAALAILFIASGRHFSIEFATALYLGMGWGAVVCYAEIARVVSFRDQGLILAGGVFYTVGALINVMNRPNLAPGVFGPHELFHLFVIAGSLAHYMFILKVIVPFERTAPVVGLPAL